MVVIASSDAQGLGLDPIFFDIHSETQRLVSTFPTFRFPREVSNAPAANAVEVLNALSRLMTVPLLTSHISNAFRPILPDLCSRWLDLLELDDLSVFEAIGVIIGIYDEIYPITLQYFDRHFEPDGPIARVMQNYDGSEMHEVLTKILLAYYRVLRVDCRIPKRYHWSLSLLVSLMNDKDAPSSVRFLAIRCYALQVGMAERERENLEFLMLGELGIVDVPIERGLRAEGEIVELDIIDGWNLFLLEEQRVIEERAKLSTSVPFIDSQNTPALWHSDFSSHVVNVSGVLLPCGQQSPPTPIDLVQTATTYWALRHLALQYSLHLPTLLTSLPGAGKALIISYLAERIHPGTHRQVVSIHLSDTSIDPKSLFGSYITSLTHPGTFEWIDGPVVTAMREGKWLVLEDVDKATDEVLGTIIPLVQSLSPAKGLGDRASINLPDRDRIIAHDNFALFATRSLNRSETPTGPYSPPPPTFLGHQYWSEVAISPPNAVDQELILASRFPRLVGFPLKSLISTYNAIHTALKGIASSRDDRAPSFRDLMKWANRVEGLFPVTVLNQLPSTENVSQVRSSAHSNGFANPAIREAIYLEAHDVFLGASPSPVTDTSSPQYPAAKVIAEQLDISTDRLAWLLEHRVPDLRVERSETDGRNRQVSIGRATIRPHVDTSISALSISNSRPFAVHRPALLLLEKLAMAVQYSEPLLLIGETGTGKTTAIQHLASLLSQPLTVVNLSNQSEAGDLIGGFKPLDVRVPAMKLQSRFIQLFDRTFGLKRNSEHSEFLRKAVAQGKWKRVVALWKDAVAKARDRTGRLASSADLDSPRKKRRVEGSAGVTSFEMEWDVFGQDVSIFEAHHVLASSKFSFAFIEGPLTRAIRLGHWILLDEINLASSETLEALIPLLASNTSSLTLVEKGSLEPVPRHPSFRIFGSMNPATDVGKKNLPPSVRSSFTEVWVPPPDEVRPALVAIVEQYIGHVTVAQPSAILDVAEYYEGVRRLARSGQLADGSNHRPHFSMRTLVRALTFASDVISSFGLRRALWEGCWMAFNMTLDEPSSMLVKQLAEQYLLSGVSNKRALLAQLPTLPASNSEDTFVSVGPFHLRRGPLPPHQDSNYILTPSVQRKLIDLSRIILTRRFPVLIEGPTSAGKTSSIEYLAQRTGHRFVRINNHEHTDIQEYVGTYVSDPTTGKLVFRDGLLVRALRRGDWIVLDELNLAPTDVLEALNRLLDDNRELLITETQEVVKPHPNFMLFATQNPAGIYGGRKVLSRAFRNRFLEVHFIDVPQAELETILHQRCRVAPSYAQRIVAVFRELQKRRQASRVFESRGSFATLRDLFRWAGRQPASVQELAEIGYMLLAERARREDDRILVKEVVESVLKVVLDPTPLYATLDLPRLGVTPPSSGLTWTSSLRRAFILLATALKNHEPVLLVGETGSGKTSLAEFMANGLGRDLVMLNCHQNTEVGDLLGSQRPVRNRAALRKDACNVALQTFRQLGISLDDVDPNDVNAHLQTISSLLREAKDSPHSDRLYGLRQRLLRIDSLFDWEDGPLVKSMKGGSIFLMDEISLADDSVLERLNSVLEPSRILLLAERGGFDVSDVQILPEPGFEIIATMNPGGDYGKKELSPALRNRFTEIWIPPLDSKDDRTAIVNASWLHSSLQSFTPPLIKFADWMCREIGSSTAIGLRDLLGWVAFSNAVLSNSDTTLSNEAIFHHAAYMTILDGLGSLPHMGRDVLPRLREESSAQLHALVPLPSSEIVDLNVFDVSRTESYFTMGPFSIPLGPEVAAAPAFSMRAPTAGKNMMRILRACQIRKPILLEGSPGVGKTSLVAALAALTGHRLCRVNLSDQTDIMDLFGSDLPADGGRPGDFEWKDAGFLRALQLGEWVLLDEMNLAPQAVLEGLNSILDHRGTVFVPELGRTFVRHPRFRIFAAQNPLHQGGGRKGLPKSFLNRFVKVHIQELNSEDLLLIGSEACPELPREQLARMIEFILTLQSESGRGALGVEGSPWEFNLRDLQRWLALHQGNPFPHSYGVALEHVDILFSQRFRTPDDRNKVMSLATAILPYSPIDSFRPPVISIGPAVVQIGTVLLKRQHECPIIPRYCVSHALLPTLQASAACVERGWLLILTGPSGSGKTCVATALADLTGSKLQTISMSGSVDASDLIGSFQQVDPRRQYCALACSVIARWERLTIRQPVELGSQDSNAILKLQHVVSNSAASFEQSLALDILRASCRVLDDSETSGLLDEIELMKQRWDQAGTQFEWFDGPIVSAMKSGSWLLLDNANLCNPAVLDRLNSLCEGRGSLALSERGLVNGEVEVLQPHPNFRLIMTVNPSYGELSRAMRNRGVEVACVVNNSMDALALLSSGVQGERVKRASSDEAISAELNRRGLIAHAGDPAANAWFGGDDRVARWGSINAYVARINFSPYRSEALLFHLLRSTLFQDRLRVLRAARFSLSTVTMVERIWICDALCKLTSSSLLLHLDAKGIGLPKALNEWAKFQPVDLDIVAPPSGLSLPWPQFRDILELSVRYESLFNRKDTFLPSSLYHGAGSLSLKHEVVAWIMPLFQEANRYIADLISSLTIDGSDYKADMHMACLFLDLLEYIGRIDITQGFNLTAIRCVITSIAQVISAQSTTRSLQTVIDNLLQLTSLKTGRWMSAIWNAFLLVSTPPASNMRILDEFASRIGFGQEDLRRRALEVISMSTLFHTTSNQFTPLDTLIESITTSVSDHARSGCQEIANGNGASLLLVQLRILSENLVKRLGYQQIKNMISVATVTPGIHLLPLGYWQHLVWAYDDLSSDTTPNNADNLSTTDFAQRTWCDRAVISMNWMKSCWMLDEDKEKGLDGPASFLHPVLLREVIRTARIGDVTLDQESTWNAALYRQISYCLLHAEGLSRPRSNQLLSFLLHSLMLTLPAFPDAYSLTQSKKLVASLARAADDPSRSNLIDMCAAIRSTDNHYFEAAMLPLCETLLDPSLVQISSIPWLVVGKAFVAFSLAFIHLYIPDSAMDPLVALRTRNDCIRSSVSRLQTYLDVNSRLEHILTSHTSNPCIQSVECRIQDLSRKFTSIPLPRDADIFRLNQLFGELGLFTTHVLPKLSHLFTTSAGTVDLANGDVSIQGSIEGFCRRLESAHSDQSDIVWPILWALQHSRIGLRLWNRGCSTVKSIDPAFSEAIIRFPSITSARQFRSFTVIADIPSSRCEAVLLQISGIVLEASCSTPIGEYRDRLQTCYEHIVSLWLKDREREQQLAAEAGSIYRQHGTSGDGRDEAELDEEEFRQLFPTLDFEGSGSDNAATASQSTSNTSVSEGDMLELLQMHLTLFHRPAVGARYIQSHSRYKGYCRDVASRLIDSKIFFHLSDKLDSQSTPWMFSLLLDQNNRDSNNRDPAKYNFYRDPNTQEIRKATTVLQSLRTRLTSLSQEWPDHMVLRHLLDHVDKVLGLRVQSPVAMVLGHLETLIGHMEDWEGYASRETSLKSLQNDLIGLIVSWRQLELNGWAQLLEVQSQSMENGVAEWWFRLYELLIRSPLSICAGDDDALSSIADHLAHVSPLLDQFMREGPIGQFEIRLNLLESFSNYGSSLTADTPSRKDQNLLLVTRHVDALVQHYRLANPSITAEIKRLREPTEKEMRDYIKLASWKDVNIHALKQSANNTHRHLHRCIRLFREALRSSVPSSLLPQVSYEHLANGSTYTLESSPEPSIDHVFVPVTALADETLFERFTNILNSDVVQVVSAWGCGAADILVTSIISTSRVLSAVPVPNKPKENEKEFKSLLTRKKRALADLLKELKRIGLPPSLKPQLVSRQNSRSQMLGSAIPSVGLPQQVKFLLEKSEDYFHRLVNGLETSRSAFTVHNSDVPTRDLQRLLWNVEAIFAFSLELRDQLGTVGSQFARLSGLADRLQPLSDDKESLTHVGTSIITNVDRAIESLGILSSGLQESLEVLSDILVTNPTPIPSHALQRLRTEFDATEQVRAQLVTLHGKICGSPIPMLLRSEYAVLQRAQEHMIRAREVLHTLVNEAPATGHFLMPVLEGLDISLGSWAFPQINAEATTPVNNIIPSLLVVVQGLRSWSMKEEWQVEHDSDGYYRRTVLAWQAFGRVARLSSIESQLELFLHGLVQHHDTWDILLKDAIIGVLPFLNEYVRAMEKVLTELTRCLKTSFKLCYVLCSLFMFLSEKGFCKPLEESSSEEKSTEGALEGTGIGDGSGTDNVSKDIEDESQVEGLQGEASEPPPQSTTQGSEDAIEMSQDFDGTLEDVDGSEPGDEDESSDTSEIQDQVADIDPTDPNAVDEKLWGDKNDIEDTPEGGTNEDHSNSKQGPSDIVAKEHPGREEGQPHDEQQDDEVDDAAEMSCDDLPDAPDDQNENGGGGKLDERIQDADTLELPESLDLDQDTQNQDDSQMDIGDIGDEDLDNSEEAHPTDEIPEHDDTELHDGSPEESSTETRNQLVDKDNEPTAHEVDGDAQRPTDDSSGQELTQNRSTEHTPEDITQAAGVDQSSSTSMEASSRTHPSYNEELNTPDLTDHQPSLEQRGEEPLADAQVGGATTGLSKGPLNPLQSPDSEPQIPNPLRNLQDAVTEVQRRFETILSRSEPIQNRQLEFEQVEYASPEEENQEMQALGPRHDDADPSRLRDLKIVEDERIPQWPITDMPQTDPSLEVHQPSSALEQNEAMMIDDAKLNDTLETLNEAPNYGNTDDNSPDDLLGPPNDAAVELNLHVWEASGRPERDAHELWTSYESLTQELAYSLCEQLRLILEPTLATRLKGDYRTGKRLNMKKIIPYIASEFSKDKIWLRRTRPSKREYQILLALDDSKSMREGRASHLAFGAMALIIRALDRLEAGDVGVIKFGRDVEIVRSFDQSTSSRTFSDNDGARILSSFTFSQPATNVLSLIDRSLTILSEARNRRSSSSTELWQLQLIISDGICDDHDRLRAILRKATEERVLIVFVVVDGLNDHSSSIMSMKQASYQQTPDGKLDILTRNYMDTFPFEYFIILKNIEMLPDVLSTTLRQFVERTSEN